MFVGRNDERLSIQKHIESGAGGLSVVYGRSGIGKTALVKMALKNQSFFYYSCANATKELSLSSFKETIRERLGFYSVDEPDYAKSDSYEKLLGLTKRLDGAVKVIVIDEFQHIAKLDDSFMEAIVKLVRGELYSEPVYVILISSSISWIENGLVATIGARALAINDFIKLKELAFVDIVRMFPAYTVPECMLLYAVTGGVPGYLSRFTDKLSVKENICRVILDGSGYLRYEGNRYVGEELRETSVYNTILKYIAGGATKLNELHVLTGYGRDKISVYLKNMAEREIVDKVFSFESDGREYTRKGLYRIKSGFTAFWYRYVYSRDSLLEVMGAEEYYDSFIASDIDEFVSEAFVKVGVEFLGLLDNMGRLPIRIERTGRWWGKNGDIDYIGVSHDNRYVIAKCSWLKEVFSYQDYLELLDNVALADIGSDYVYLFSRDSFDEELSAYAKSNRNISLISLKDL